MPGVAQSGDLFGSQVAAAPDLVAIGAPQDSDSPSRSGTVTILRCGATQLTTSSALMLTQAMLPGAATPSPDDRFGSALAFANLGRSNELDLAIGAPGAWGGPNGDVPQAGAVYVVHQSAGSFSLPTTRVIGEGLNGFPDVAQAGERFGSSLLAANFGRDARIDLAIGAPGESTSKGLVMVAYGGTVLERSTSTSFGPSPLFVNVTVIVATGAQLFRQGAGNVDEIAESGDRFGSALGGGSLP
jgi:hypothetical protein